MRVLIVDDNPTALALLRGILGGAGFEVVEASDGRQALAAIRAGAARLVICDVEAPLLGGMGLCEAVRSEDLPGYVYMILLSGQCSVGQKVAGLAAGADDYMCKPFEPPELVARVRAGERVLSLETRDVAIFALARLLESRDPAMGARLERIRCYARALAQQLATVPRFRAEVTGEFIRLLYITCPLHDIGKVGIPDSVLLKTGPLTDAESEVMKRHTTLGGETLDAAARNFPGVAFLEMARDIALHHHERWDGTGYPAGLAGERIPLCARIVALADAYDALTTRRLYKGAVNHDVARSVIEDESGRQFDPEIVRGFLACQGQFKAIRERFGTSSRKAA